MIEVNETRNEALARALEEFRDVLAAAITSTTLSYERLGSIYGVSGSTVYKLAKARGLRREADKAPVIEDSQFGDRTLMNTSQPIEVTEHEASLLACGLLHGVTDPSAVATDAQHEQAAEAVEVSNEN